ncbi:uncharacterized protein LOC130692179 [Daphnia carinata]|uniref:uncharacterized protein LOC130692179 n=1 Tax=Daphnia carinata TaxID=120202 RepID=UPI0028687449|nr:uncharacterized protein LOC130692179 [Daphnia carinata]
MLSPAVSVAVVIRLKADEQQRAVRSSTDSRRVQFRGIKMELTTFSFLFLLTITGVCGRQYPLQWPQSSIEQHRRSALAPVTPYNEKMDASEWLESLLGSLLTAEPAGNGEQRPQTSAQRIFQREARPSVSFVQDSPSGKRRFSLASIRVNPNSVKRQHIFAVPDMTLLQLENPTRLPTRVEALRPTVRPPLPQRQRDNEWQPVNHYRQEPYVQALREQQYDYTGELSFENPAEESSSPPERHFGVDVYVNRYSKA